MSLFLGSGLGKFVGLRGLHSGTTWKYGHLVRLCQRVVATRVVGDGAHDVKVQGGV
jgi:hypothetical protein